MNIKIMKLHPNAQAPVYGSDDAGCFDLHAATVDGYSETGSVIHADHPVVCGTGLAFEIPKGRLMLIFSRSGHGFKDNVRLANCIGAIDADYRGEVKVKLTCDIDTPDDAPPLRIDPGSRVAQALIIPAERVTFTFSDELSETERGAGGFGSTGK